MQKWMLASGEEADDLWITYHRSKRDFEPPCDGEDGQMSTDVSRDYSLVCYLAIIPLPVHYNTKMVMVKLKGIYDAFHNHYLKSNL